MENKEIILTAEGLDELKVELQNLINNVRPKVIEELVEARAQGDLSENADYDAARNRQAEVEARIKEVEIMISKATVISKTKSGELEVRIGSTVEFENQKTKKQHTIKIVGIIEADPFENMISNESPLAKSMLGKVVGDIVDIKDLKEPYKIKIKSIK